MARQIAFFILALAGWAGSSHAAGGEGAGGGERKKVCVVAIETRGIAPQLAKRLRVTVVEALKAEGLQTFDMVDDYAFLAECHFRTECFSAALKRLNLDYLLLARLWPSASASPGKPVHEIEVRLGRIPRGSSVWGPWPMSTACRDCSDTELSDSMHQLVARTWKAMLRAELAPQDIEVSAKDRRAKGANLVRLADDDSLPTPEQIHLLKKAIRAGAGGLAFSRLAWIFFACGGYDEAEDYAAKAAADGEKMDDLLGPLLWLTGRWTEALPVFQRLVQAFPSDKRWQKSLEELNRRSHDNGGVLGQAEDELKRNDASKAAQLARIALASGRGIKAHLILAKVSMESQSYADALAQFIAVLEAEPNNAEAAAGKQKAEVEVRKARELRARR
jgi:tetratricopeptide (TPR) repeat protein